MIDNRVGFVKVGFFDFLLELFGIAFKNEDFWVYFNFGEMEFWVNFGI